MRWSSLLILIVGSLVAGVFNALVVLPKFEDLGLWSLPIYLILPVAVGWFLGTKLAERDNRLDLEERRMDNSELL